VPTDLAGAGQSLHDARFPALLSASTTSDSAATRTGQIDLGSPDRTEKRTGTMSWRYENKIKVA
jgi:hypothetical protein